MIVELLVSTTVIATATAPVISPVQLPWIFQEGEWLCLSSPGTHRGDDAFAHDWIAKSPTPTLDHPVLAALSGVIALIEDHPAYGKTLVIVDDKSKLALRYAHLGRVDVSSGQVVEAGKTRVGTIGRSGLLWFQPAHLHLSLYHRVQRIDDRPITTVLLSERHDGFAAPFLLGGRDCPTRN